MPQQCGSEGNDLNWVRAVSGNLEVDGITLDGSSCMSFGSFSALETEFTAMVENDSSKLNLQNRAGFPFVYVTFLQ